MAVKNEILACAATEMDLENTRLRKIIPSLKAILYHSVYIKCSDKPNS